MRAYRFSEAYLVCCGCFVLIKSLSECRVVIRLGKSGNIRECCRLWNYGNIRRKIVFHYLPITIILEKKNRNIIQKRD